MKPSKNTSAPTRIHFIANCVYGDHLAGGDIHFLNMAEAAIDAGFLVNFFGGHALKKHLAERNIQAELTLTDHQELGAVNMSTLTGQLRLLINYLGRFLRTLRLLSNIKPDDLVYAVTDYWFDTWPAILCRAKVKLLILGMDAPTLAEIVFRRRPDVPASRLNSIYYWLSQNLSLKSFKFCKSKRLFYVHTNMKSRLLRLGYKKSELVFISNGFDLKTANSVPEPAKQFDVIWIGRPHRQKGIDDLLACLAFLSKRLPDFRAVLVGKLEELAPKLAELGLSGCVHLSGLVSEEEKFRLFKASRVFLIPSRYESWGIVIGEALACRVPVVAYELAAYRPVFGGLVVYIPPFDSNAFNQAALAAVENTRKGQAVFDANELAKLLAEHSWDAARHRFQRTLLEFVNRSQ